MANECERRFVPSAAETATVHEKTLKNKGETKSTLNRTHALTDWLKYRFGKKSGTFKRKRSKSKCGVAV